jgi:hypothetical protein
MQAGKRLFVTGLALALLAGCGFQLRQAPDFVFDSILVGRAGQLAARQRAQAQHRLDRRVRCWSRRRSSRPRWCWTWCWSGARRWWWA